MKESQNKMVKDHLKKYGNITPRQALMKYGIFRLASRIYDLKREGFRTRMVMQYQYGKKWAKYICV